MQVIFDVTCLMPEKLSGIGVYSKNLYRALQSEGIECLPVVKVSRAFKKNHVFDHIEKKPKIFIDRPRLRKKDWVLHGPDFRLLSARDVYKKIVTVHDVAVFHQGFNSEPFRERGQSLMRALIHEDRPDSIIVPSETIRDEVVEHFPETQGKVFAIPHGVDHFSFEMITAPFKPDYPYFLYIGHLEKRKNLKGVIEAFEIHCDKIKDTRLIVVGKEGFGGGELISMMENSRHKHRILYKGYVSSPHLKALYKGAQAFVFPSFYEGFGFPILEAMKFECPVITSNHGTMAEVAGDSALLVDAQSNESISEAMNRLCDDHSYRKKLIEKGCKRVEEFTWKKTAQRVLNLYRS